MGTKYDTFLKEYFVGKTTNYLSVLCVSVVFIVTHTCMVINSEMINDEYNADLLDSNTNVAKTIF